LQQRATALREVSSDETAAAVTISRRAADLLLSCNVYDVIVALRVRGENILTFLARGGGAEIAIMYY
jgi:hypothetical protein